MPETLQIFDRGFARLKSLWHSNTFDVFVIPSKTSRPGRLTMMKRNSASILKCAIFLGGKFSVVKVGTVLLQTVFYEFRRSAFFSMPEMSEKQLSVEEVSEQLGIHWYKPKKLTQGLWQAQIRGIPSPWLIDREGKLISFQARGAELKRLVAEAVKDKPEDHDKA